MKPREYQLMQECVDRGVSYGLHRAKKHLESPSDEQFKEAIAEAVMASVAEYWTFDDNHSD